MQYNTVPYTVRGGSIALLQQARITMINKMVVLLIKPSQYDSDGVVYRFHRQVLPSPAMGVLYALTMRAMKNVLPQGVEMEVHALEDGISSHARQLRKMERRFPEHGTRLVVGLIGVQTAQFPRACELAQKWRAHGAVCVVGGPHVTASITALHDGVSDQGSRHVPCPEEMPREIQTFMDEGGVVFHGEAEPTIEKNPWAQVLSDILHGDVKSLYRAGRPDITTADFPEYGVYRKAFVPNILPIQLSRGCPYACEFCAVVNMLGRKVRGRDPCKVLEYIRGVCQKEGRASFFFTDDNFGRNPFCEEIVGGLIALAKDGYDLNFMIQADMKLRPDFVKKLSQAGCGNIFFGVESLDPQNLASAGKTHNVPSEYASLWHECNRHGITVHVAYIIGFPHDTPSRVISAVDTLVELGAGQASFFMLQPLPGSTDHARMVVNGEAMDPDLNRYDSTYAVVDHPRMTRSEWSRVFRQAYRRFYSPAHMITMLQRLPCREKRLRLLCNFLWYWWSVRVEDTHPMIAGFWREYCWRDRRSKLKDWSNLFRFIRLKIGQPFRYAFWFMAGFYVFQHVLFETEFAPVMKEGRHGLVAEAKGLRSWLRLTFGRCMSRRWLNDFWVRYGRQKWKLLSPSKFIWHIRAIPFAITEIVYTVRMWLIIPSLVRIMSNRK